MKMLGLQMTVSDLESWSVPVMSAGEEHVLLGEGEEDVLMEEVVRGPDQSSGLVDQRVPGRLLGRQEAFKKVGAEPYVQETVKSGYKLVWDTGPPPSSFTDNNKSARDDLPWVRQEVERLNSLQCVRRVNERPEIVLPLSKVFSNKDRLVLDASRGLNPWCRKRGVKLDGLGSIMNSIRPGDYLVTNDLARGSIYLNLVRRFLVI